MPFGFYPSVKDAGAAPAASKYFKEYDEAMAPALEQSKRSAEARYQATVDMTQQALSHIEGLQNPVAPQPLMQVDPLGAAAAGFFAHLNMNQSGSGQAVAGLQNTLSQVGAQNARIAEGNQNQAESFGTFKQQSTEELHQALLKAKRDQAVESGNLDEAFQHNKALYALERQRKKEEMDAAKAAAEGKIAAAGAQRMKEIEARGEQQRKNTTLINRFRKEAESKATTPAQRARLAMANAEVAELRASVDDMRAAKDIAGEPLHTEEEIAAREEAVRGQIKTIYESAITDFEAEKDKGTVRPGATSAAPATPTTPAAGSDRVRAAAERLRGTSLFAQ